MKSARRSHGVRTMSHLEDAQFGAQSAIRQNSEQYSTNYNFTKTYNPPVIDQPIRVGAEIGTACMIVHDLQSRRSGEAPHPRSA
jgi:hypothetical protein